MDILWRLLRIAAVALVGAIAVASTFLAVGFAGGIVEAFFDLALSIAATVALFVAGRYRWPLLAGSLQVEQVG